MRSIRTKMTLLIIAAILVSVIAAGGVGIIAVKTAGDRNSRYEMQLLCDSLRKTLDDPLGSVMQSVGAIAMYAGDDLDRGGDADIPAHVRRVEAAFNAAAANTAKAVAYYYRLSPEFGRGEPGFLYALAPDGAFGSVEPTDIAADDPDDLAHVGWFTLPMRSGTPLWIAPHTNENLGIEMISYVWPVYCGEAFAGVAGMDIEYAALAAHVESIRIYDTGYACLVGQDGGVVCHPVLERGTRTEEAAPALADAAIPDDGVALVTYRYGSVDKRAACCALSNDMRLIVVAPVREIDAGWHALARYIIIASLAILVVFIVIATISMCRVTGPLQRLTAASKRLAAGDYNVQLEDAGDDEVGILTRSFQHLVRHLGAYISDLNSKAYKDALTSVRNKGAFDIFARKLDDVIRASDADAAPEFAVVMLDCNELKEINDSYGHEKGDLYLQNSCRLICTTFAHSPVFRLGGDEFAAVLQRDDFTRRDELLDAFDRRADEINAAAANPWDGISLAKGMAVFDPRADANVDSVLRRADARMYEEKNRYKAAQAART